jgi:hypothetical protein
MDITEAQRVYQMNLEAHRVDPDDELVYDHLLKAKAELEVAWLREVSSV